MLLVMMMVILLVIVYVVGDGDVIVIVTVIVDIVDVDVYFLELVFRYTLVGTLCFSSHQPYFDTISNSVSEGKSQTD